MKRVSLLEIGGRKITSKQNISHVIELLPLKAYYLLVTKSIFRAVQKQSPAAVAKQSP